MKEHTVAAVIAVDPDELLAFVADLSNDVRWRHDLAVSELVSGVAGEPKSVYRQKGTTPGRDDPYLIALDDLDRSARVAAFSTVDRSPVAFGGRYRIRDTPAGAEITFGVWVRARGLLRFVAPFMGKAVRANSTRYLADLTALLEAP
ncbi:Polyketide cyclase / dehydrase and lipid transport [Microbacterium sp. cf046]|uniref:SRPBCC family protein n=1 Tax=Microbacterium sp. cf046 TaxID=1761803 RepID=UPI0008EFA6B4|nr:SRPBCC family protein [Microbacterium sp. cf046]SFR87162.1 Polyketide cyclase / dehydrase and lipid transport [Microbacterium sp. cf046]